MDKMEVYDCIIVGSGPAGLGAATTLISRDPKGKILILEKNRVSTGGLRNDCKMNFTFPIGFPLEYWTQEEADLYLDITIKDLNPDFMEKSNVSIYTKRAEKLGVTLLNVRQTHLGTDGGLELIKELTEGLKKKGVDISLEEEMHSVNEKDGSIVTDKRELGYKNLIIAPGRQGFRFLQKIMDSLGVPYMDHIVDIGIRLETKLEHYPIVQDYYDPKFLFPDKVRTFCTNSGSAYVVKEKYLTAQGDVYYSVNGHAFSGKREANGLVNLAMLKTVTLSEPLASGQLFAEMLGRQAMLMGGGKPLMQRVGDFRLGKRSKKESFNNDLYDFKPTLEGASPGDISLAVPARILRTLWKSLKYLDTIVPGILHPSTIMYYPEIKLYANKPGFQNRSFRVKPHIYMIGDGAGTSRGITGAWASGIRAAVGILENS